MKIAVINGSPKGRDSITHRMVSSFLRGAEQTGADTVTVVLAEEHIVPCRGCFACWFATPGRCIICDDAMAEILDRIENAGVVVLATPLMYANVSSLLKRFVERLLVFSSPYILPDRGGETRHPRKVPEAESAFYRAKLIAIANGGLGQRGHFQVVSHWMKRLALNNLTEVIGEIYLPQGPLLAHAPAALQENIANYLGFVQKAGAEIATGGGISAGTTTRLNENLVPEELYLQQINDFFSTQLADVKHPYIRSWEQASSN